MPLVVVLGRKEGRKEGGNSHEMMTKARSVSTGPKQIGGEVEKCGKARTLGENTSQAGGAQPPPPKKEILITLDYV